MVRYGTCRWVRGGGACWGARVVGRGAIGYGLGVTGRVLGAGVCRCVCVWGGNVRVAWEYKHGAGGVAWGWRTVSGGYGRGGSRGV